MVVDNSQETSETKSGGPRITGELRPLPENPKVLTGRILIEDVYIAADGSVHGERQSAIDASEAYRDNIG